MQQSPLNFARVIVASCEDIDEEVFIKSGDGNALMDFINLVDDCTNPDATYTITDKGREYLKQQNKEE